MIICTRDRRSAGRRPRHGTARALTVALALSFGVILSAHADSAPTPATLGRAIFNDVSLSASGKLACASCHVPENAHAQTNNVSVQSGGATSDVPGFRAVPSLRYLNFNLPFFFQNDGTPTGGFDRDGRAGDLVEQARRPFLAAHEMANVDAAALAQKLSQATYADAFRKVFGANIFSDADTAFLAAVYSVSSFEMSAREFRPYDSKFDSFMQRKVMLSTQELRGFSLFNRPDKGACAGCHPSTRQPDGSLPVFTDYTYDNLGVPRNAEIAANADSNYFDMGLCGPERTDLAKQTQFCGQFKVPTLRNVATRHVIFHNGNFHDLRKAIEFYVQRDTNPEKWYPLDADGGAQKFNDIPAAYVSNVNTAEPPYNRHPGEAPALSESEIDDVMAFLGTLTDGYDPVTNTADPARDVPTLAAP